MERGRTAGVIAFFESLRIISCFQWFTMKNVASRLAAEEVRVRSLPILHSLAGIVDCTNSLSPSSRDEAYLDFSQLVRSIVANWASKAENNTMCVLRRDPAAKDDDDREAHIDVPSGVEVTSSGPSSSTRSAGGNVQRKVVAPSENSTRTDPSAPEAMHPRNGQESDFQRFLDYVRGLEAGSFGGAEREDQTGVEGTTKSAIMTRPDFFVGLHSLATKKQQLVVIASLLDSPVNIAGLCRCGDVFAIEEITVPDRKVFDHPHFLAVARSAEQWLPWREVAALNLDTHLLWLKTEGYTVVGIEQTAESIPISSFAFPQKTAIVLGSEGQGIPPDILLLCDVCVEIPQFGLIRSLNVHVTGGLVMYEFTKQHRMKTVGQNKSQQNV